MVSSRLESTLVQRCQESPREVVLIGTVWKHKTGFFHHAGSFFLPPILKGKRRKTHQLANMRRPSSTAYLRTFVSSISLIPNHGVLDSRQALLLRIERHRRPGETIQGPMDGSQVVWKTGFWVGQSSFCWKGNHWKNGMKMNKQTYVKRLVWLSHPMFSGQKLEVLDNNIGAAPTSIWKLRQLAT